MEILYSHILLMNIILINLQEIIEMKLLRKEDIVHLLQKKVSPEINMQNMFMMVHSRTGESVNYVEEGRTGNYRAVIRVLLEGNDLPYEVRNCQYDVDIHSHTVRTIPFPGQNFKKEEL